MTTLLKLTCAAILAGAVAVAPANCAEPGLSLTISGPKDAVKPGSEVVVKLALKNETDHELRLVTAVQLDNLKWAEIHFRATAIDGYGNHVPYTKYGRETWSSGAGFDGSVNAVQMQPGEQWNHELELSRLLDISKPGTYTVQITRLNFEDTQHAATESNTIVVTVSN